MKKKSLNAKITHRGFVFKKILRDKKIFQIFKSFEKNFKNLNNTEKVIVAVSGGPDSLALCFLLSYYAYKNKNIKPFFYLVDHGLRKGSAREALQVKKLLSLNNINLKILKWKGAKPHSNLQSIARKKRYEILFRECKKNKIETIVTAHHQDDLYETFFSRLLRGSGTEGLSSFSQIQKSFFFKGNTIIVTRPLLNFTKQNLIYIAKNVYDHYLEDPSNEMDKFQRVKLRKLILNLRKEGLDFKKLKLTIKNLASSNKAINEIIDKNISDNVFFYNQKCLIGPKFFFNPEEIVFRSFSNLIKKISKKDYPPRGRKIVNLVKELGQKDRYKATLGGTIIEKIHNSVIVTKEKTKIR